MLKNKVIQAYNYAQRKHRGQKRKFVDLPYFTHPKYVARLVEKLTNNETLIIAALLHDVLEDTDTGYYALAKKFGVEVAGLVSELTNDPEEKKSIGKTALLCKKMQSISEDALLIKLADRFHNVRFLDHDKIPRKFIEKRVLETIAMIEAVNQNRQPNKVCQMLMVAIMADVEMLRLIHSI